MDTPIVQNKKGQINIVLQDRNETSEKEGFLKPSFVNNRNRPFSHIDEKFATFVGMSDLKQMVKQIYATMVVNEKRNEIGLKTTPQVLHMMFKGNPGTGKTTVARQLAKVYFDLNILSKGHFIEAERADLVGEYIGQTAQKTRGIVQKALGGILFIDEAYSLGRGGEKDFGKEAIDTLVKNMEDHGSEFVLILAGYPKEMERFLELNPGLQSRFPFIVDFDDYNTNELMNIAKQKFSDREYRLTKEAEVLLRSEIEKERKSANFSNGRFVRNIVEQSIRMHAIRVMTRELFSPDELCQITATDLAFCEKTIS